ncbi:MAG: hypothetical protein KatS3mg070_1552 [Meiothermus sp.]|uniref:hypothetical protein n=1 Tax=Meiothermus sp. TaxID=1955249 RepID=UPI0021DC56CE|nr:hypothetical protein [Meiothermus sp.]GIW28189.1 MAG: hypothetical protein KatS3mg070_1552 [Meiothermus sp.]
MGQIYFSTDDLAAARVTLEAAGFTVETPPPAVLEHNVLLVAYHPETFEGYLLTPQEIKLVAYQGLVTLDSGYPDPRPRWQRDERRRAEKYVEAALARAIVEVQSAAPGNRNNVLSRVAFSLGQLENLGLDRMRVQDALEEAALSIGLSLQEARCTIRRGLEKGSQAPRDLPDNRSGFGAFWSFGAPPHSKTFSDNDGHSSGFGVLEHRTKKPVLRFQKPRLGR